MYRKSIYTFCQKTEEGDYVLLNLFSGALDIVTSDVAEFIMQNDSIAEPEEGNHFAFFKERGYYVPIGTSELELAKGVGKYYRFKAAEHSQPKYLIFTGLGCNLSCSYCWQVLEKGPKQRQQSLLSEARIGAVFKFIEEDLKSRTSKTAFISLFGGEPLIANKASQKLFEYIAKEVKNRGYHLHLATNGRDLLYFIEQIRQYQPSIQVTVDGYKNGALARNGVCLEDIYSAICDLVRKDGVCIHVRFLANCDTAAEFVSLADRIFRENLPDERFILAVAPIQDKANRYFQGLSSKSQILHTLLLLLKDKPYAKRIAFLDWRSLNIISNLRKGKPELSNANFFHCEANTSLWCLGDDGLLYTCYETVGDQRFAVGRYDPDIQINKELLNQYRQRTPFAISRCMYCVLSPLCAGGCMIRGFKHNKDFSQPYCDGLNQEMKYLLSQWNRIQAIFLRD